VRKVTYSAPPFNPDGRDTDPVLWYATLLDGRSIAIPGPEFDEVRELIRQLNLVAADVGHADPADTDPDLDPIDPASRAWWATETREEPRTIEPPSRPRKPATRPRRAFSEVSTDEDLLPGRIG
jgi:hypothetical protein